MESTNPINRTIGIILAVIVMIAVGGVTFVNERRASSTSVAQSASSPVTVATKSSPVKSVAKPLATKPSVVAVSNVPARTSSEEGEGDDDGVARATVPATPSQPVNTPVTPTPPPATVPKQTASVYTNGTYTATGSYMSPGGQEQLSVTLTLVNDIITAVSVTPGAYDRRSQNYQNMFISGYQQYVIGKNIADVNLGAISGSSLTPIGFNDALAQIKSQAKA